VDFTPELEIAKERDTVQVYWCSGMKIEKSKVVRYGCQMLGEVHW